MRAHRSNALPKHGKRVPQHEDASGDVPVVHGSYVIGDPTHHRPGYDGRLRDASFPDVRWRDVDDVVHQAAGESNLTLCELKRHWLHLEMMYCVPLDTPLTCVGCVGERT